MRIQSRLIVRTLIPVTALAFALPVLAWRPSAEQLTLQPESRLWVEGKSTIRDFSCKAVDLDASIDAVPNAVAKVAAGEKAIRSVRITVPAEKMDCGNGTMNGHMKKALKVEENPTIVFKLTSYDISKTASGTAGTLTGTLSLGGQQKTIAIPAEGSTEGGVLHVTGAYELKMSDYDLEPPSLMFGRIKVRDAVNVKFDLLIKA